ncbi:DNA polymerase sliding clamp [uncultured archaeon]|nr:DNA polymerase sliding clamp [uncultured archaeon]
MFELKLDNARYWRDCIEAIVSLVDEGLFTITKEGIGLKAMDPSGISMISFFMPSKAFATYEIDKVMSIGLNLDNLSKIMARTRDDEALVMKDTDSKIALEFVGEKSRRRYKLQLIDVKKSVEKEPNVEFDANIEIDGEHLKNALKDATLISSYISFKASKGQFAINAKGDSGELEELHEIDGGRIKKVDVTKDASSVFNLEFLENMVKSTPTGNAINLSLKSDQPLKMSYNIGDANVTYFLAPYVEE